MRVLNSLKSEEIFMISKFYIFGDSICFGQHVSLHDTWAVRISSYISTAIYPTCVVQNASINGNTTDMAMIRFEQDILSHRPDFLMIQFGMNDCNYWETDGGKPRVEPVIFRSNLMKMVSDAVEHGVKHIFLNTNHPSRKGEFRHVPGLLYEDSNAFYNHIIRDVCKELLELKFAISLIDIEKEFTRYLELNKDLRLSDLLLQDGIHLSRRGHDFYYQVIIRFLCKESVI